MEKHLYFVRHGESTSNKEKIYHGSTAPLTDAGKQQAEQVAERFTRIQIDAVVSSSYARARQTAEPIARVLGLSIEKSDLFVECRRPSIQRGKAHGDESMLELSNSLVENYAIPRYRHSDEENFEDIKARALKAVEFLTEHPAERIAIATHGIFLRALFCAFVAGPEFTGIDFQRAYRSMGTDNTGISYIKTYPYGWLVVSWNDSSHLG
jgi:broad specificity phosphatase PhoE